MSERNERILAMVEQLTVSELAQLIEIIKDRFGVSDLPIRVPAPASVQEEVPAPDPLYDVIIEEIGPQKVGLIKAIRTLLGIKLLEAKGIVDGVPIAVLKGVSADEAEAAVDALCEAGAVAILMPSF